MNAVVPISGSVERFVSQVRVNPNAVEAELPPVCPTCNGLGWLRYNVDVGQPNFGKLYRCTNPDCATREKQLREFARQFRKLSDWNDTYENMTFDGFRAYAMSLPSKHKNGGAMAYKLGAYTLSYTFGHNVKRESFSKNEASQFVNQYDWPGDDDGINSPNVVLSSLSGMGKTSLAVSATNSLWALGKAVMFISAEQLIRRFNQTYGADYTGPSDMDIAMRYADVTFLVLDELSIPNPTEKQVRLFTALLRNRVLNNCPTLITTNHNEDTFERYWGMAMSSTVGTFHWAGLEGDEIRPRGRLITV